jgi:hypothetical protein
MEKMRHVFLLLAFLINGAIPQQAQTPITDSTRLSKEQVLAYVEEFKRLIDEKIWPTFKRSVGYSTDCRKRVSATLQNSIARELWSI